MREGRKEGGEREGRKEGGTERIHFYTVIFGCLHYASKHVLVLCGYMHTLKGSIGRYRRIIFSKVDILITIRYLNVMSADTLSASPAQATP